MQLCAFSPPYWGLRKYSVNPMIWGGVDAECRHEWNLEDREITENLTSASIHKNKADKHLQNRYTFDGLTDKVRKSKISNGFCLHCNAWRGDLGLEPTPELYLAHMMQVMAEVERVLRDDGVCFVNIGDSYASNWGSGAINRKSSWWSTRSEEMEGKGWGHVKTVIPANMWRKHKSIRVKSLCLIPQKFAIKCQEAGWIIRSEIIWAKPNPMPESVRDRPTRSHEQVWMMTKQGKYYWDQDAVREPLDPDSIPRSLRGRSSHHKWDNGGPGNQTIAKDLSKSCNPSGRNIRDIWTIATEPTPEAHFATWPTKLVERMIRAATKPGDIVLDPFCGTAKTVIEAERLNRVGIGLDLSWEYLSDIAVPKLQVPLQPELCLIRD